MFSSCYKTILVLKGSKYIVWKVYRRHIEAVLVN